MMGKTHIYSKKKRIASVLLAAIIGTTGFFGMASGRIAKADTDDDDSGAILLDESKGYSTVLYNNTNGLPTSEANAIVQTPDGFIWIGSYSGLIRYDGNSFERISSADTGITSVVSLFVDSRERLWVGTNDSGAGVLERGEWTIFNKDNGLSSLSVRAIVEDENGLIYLATTEGVVTVDEDLHVIVPDETRMRKEYVRDLKLGANNTVYALTIDGAIFTMRDGKMLSFFNSQDMGISEIHSILPDPDAQGKLYIGTKGSEIYYGTPGQPLGEPFATIEPLGYVNSITKIMDEVWVCTDNGVGRIVDGHCIVLPNLPMTTSIEQMMSDYQRNIWFVSSQQGVMKIVPNRFTNLYDTYRLNADVVYSTCLSSNRLFIGTKTSGLLVMENRSILNSIPLASVTTPSGKALECNDLIALLKDAKIRSIVRDSQGRLWFCSFSDDAPLVRYDGTSAVVFTDKDGGLPTNRVRTVIECADGSFAVACTGGVAILSGDQITRIYGDSDGIANTEILSVVQASNQDLLLGTDGDGIYIISGGETRHVNTENGLKSDVVMRIKKDHKREIYWIVTSNSIAYIDENYEVTTVKQFPYSNNFDIYQNDLDEMWILSSNGIYVVPTEEMLANEEITPFYYGRDNGLSSFATSNSYSCLTPEGDLYISGSTGVVVTNINEPNEINNDVLISVPYIDVDGSRMYPNENGEFRLNYKTHKITVYAYCFNYSLVNPELSYQLDGLDRNGNVVLRSDLKPIDYTNLAGGKYTFRLQLLDANGEVKEEITVKIIKEKKVIETLWFKILTVLLIALFVTLISFVVVRKRIEKLEKKSREQKLLIREIVEAFAKVIDMKDRYTNGHSTRVAKYTAMLAEELGYDKETVEKYYNIALLHDIGKVGISIETLNKPGRLTDEEFKEIKSHSGKGYNVLKDISIMPELAVGARDHHERPDGRGYPKGMTGEEIPRVAQIIAVADTFDAMYSDRPYRKRMNFDKAISIIQEVSGTQLTADVVDAFMRLVEKGEFRAEDDQGGGTFEDISNIHKTEEAEYQAQKKAEAEKKAAEEKAKAEEEKPSGSEDAPK